MVSAVSDEEYEMLVWLCKYIICYRSKKITNAHLGVVVVLAQEIPIAMGPFVLSCIYKGISNLVTLENN